jgi:CDP-diacylglycerol---glycerol-3-phosphate 3-phosphatidyltransferase
MPMRPRWVEAGILRGLDPISNVLIRARVHPNAITTVGFFMGVAAAFAFAAGQLRLAGFLVLLGGALDIFDGRVARGTGLASVFGSFYDSTLDRISEIIVFVGILAYFLRPESGVPIAGIAYAVAFAMGGSLMVSYTRARAEALGLDCKVGMMQRAERVFLIGAAALFFGTMWEAYALRIVLVAVAVFANLTAFQRIYWVYRNTRPGQADSTPARARATKLTGKSS